MGREESPRVIWLSTASHSDTFPDPDQSLEEHRFIVTGSAESGKILVVAHTDDGEIVRIISAREATHGERKSYEEN